MGVPGFNTWFARHHKQAYVSYAGRSWDHVYIDMASVLHSAMKRGTCCTYPISPCYAPLQFNHSSLCASAAYNLPHFHRILFSRLDSIMAMSSPKKSVMFALDGPAPLAKLLTQRCPLLLPHCMQTPHQISLPCMAPNYCTSQAHHRMSHMSDICHAMSCLPVLATMLCTDSIHEARAGKAARLPAPATGVGAPERAPKQ